METNTGTAIRAAPKMITLSIATPPVYGRCPHFAKTTVANFIANTAAAEGRCVFSRTHPPSRPRGVWAYFITTASLRRELLYAECEHGNSIYHPSPSSGGDYAVPDNRLSCSLGWPGEKILPASAIVSPAS